MLLLVCFWNINVSSGYSIIHLLNNVKEKFDKREFHHAARVMVSFLFILFTIFHSPRFEFGIRQNNIYPSNLVEHNTSSHSLAVAAVFEEGCVLPCIQRLQRLEKVFNELSNNPVEILLEKDKILMESMDRIKNIETDLEKTKKVSFIWPYVVVVDYCTLDFVDLNILILLLLSQLVHATVVQQIDFIDKEEK